MTPRPTIFISAVSKELKSARQLVANTLTFLGYEPVWQDVFGTEQGDLRAMLRKQIDECKGVVQLVGRCYGAEPPAPDEQFGRVSYTQYEALYARQRGKKVWYLFLDDNFPPDSYPPEAEEVRALQAAYREGLRTQSHLYHPLANREALETSVLKLRDDLTRLRRGVKRWAAAVIVFLALMVAAVVWLAISQMAAAKLQRQQHQEMMAAMGLLPGVEARIRREQPGQDAATLQERTYVELGKLLGLDPKLLWERLPGFAAELKRAPDATAYDRANAAYAIADYPEAERLALAAADEARKAAPPRLDEAFKALELAGQAADARIEYADALRRYRSAETLTDRARDPLQWAGLQWKIGHILNAQGKLTDAEKAFRGALEEFQRKGGNEDKDVLALRNNLINVIQGQGRAAEAEKQLREVIPLEQKVAGPEHPNTLRMRSNLAAALLDEGKAAEALQEYREVLAIQTKVLGPEHPDTLENRKNQANALKELGKYPDAENEYRAVIVLETKVLGPENPDTLGTRNNLATLLLKLKKYTEAEAEHRAVFEISERVLGPEHRDTLMYRNNLAGVLFTQAKYAEAEAEYREVIKLKEKVFGPDNPVTFSSLNNLGSTLCAQGKYAEAEPEFRKMVERAEKKLGAEHPATLLYCYNLAMTLDSENKPDEAREYAKRTVEGGRKVLQPGHPDLQNYEKLWQELQAKH